MIRILFALILVSGLSVTTHANAEDADEIVSSTVTQVTEAKVNATETLSQINLSQMITIGQKIWEYVVTNKPNVQFQTIKASVVPSGITSWTQLSNWQPPISKIYHVEFKTVFGTSAGGFDYRITFTPGGSYESKGKFLGEITFIPTNITLHTGRDLSVKAEISDPLNFGSATDPVAGAQMVVSWSTPTLTRYQMSSAEYMIYGNGQIQDLSNPTP